MSKRTSIYISGQLQTRIADRMKIDSSISSTINLTADRLDWVLEKSRPELLENEWAALMEAMLNEPPKNLVIDKLIQGIEYAVEDSLDIDDLAKKWHLQRDLLELVKAFTPGEKLVVLEMSEKWRVGDAKTRIKLIKR